MLPMYAHGVWLMQPPTPQYVRKVATLTDGSQLPTLLTAVRPTSNTQEFCEEGLQHDEEDEEEGQGPSLEYTFWAIDFKPILPGILASSTILGAVCMMTAQVPILSRVTLMSQAVLSAACSVLYAVTLGCMTYCAFADPGQVKRTRNAELGVDVEKGMHGMPRRAHKSWQYPRPIRRYDHYCKWLKNTIGLLNHREFVTMLMGLTLISFMGIVVDLWVAVLVAKEGVLQSEVFVISLLAIEGPMLTIHAGLICRNETAQEWKKKQNYVANDTSLGDDVPVEQLDYNDLFDQDAFVYDRTRNPFDKGIPSNCFNFWCIPRWPSDENGEW